MDVFNALQSAVSIDNQVGQGLAIFFWAQPDDHHEGFVLLILSGQSHLFIRCRWKDLWRVLAANAVSAFYTLLGLLFFVVPGIIPWFRYWCASEVIRLENRSIPDALTRSTELTELAELNSGKS